MNLRTIIIFVFFACLGKFSLAQGLYLSPYTGYAFRTSVTTYDGQFRFQPSSIYGIRVGKNFGRNVAIDVNYNFQSTQMQRIVAGYVTGENVDLDINAMTLNFIKHFGSEKTTVYTGMGFGAVWLTGLVNGYSSTTKFSVDLDLGMVAHLSDRVGLKLEFGLTAPMYGAGVGIGCGFGGGCGLNFSSFSAVVRAHSDIGIVFNL